MAMANRSSGVPMYRCSLILLLGLLGCGPLSTAQLPSPATMDGLPAPGTYPALVLLFFSHDCPISNGYAPEVRRLWADYQPRGVVFRLVFAEADLSHEEAVRHARAYDLSLPVLHDPGLALARRFGATVVPEAVVLGPDGQRRYRGRIDDRYADYGKLRPNATRWEVRAALDALLAGRPVADAEVPALGCAIDFGPSARSH